MLANWNRIKAWRIDFFYQSKITWGELQQTGYLAEFSTYLLQHPLWKSAAQFRKCCVEDREYTGARPQARSAFLG
jgi:hypothetical protein